MIVELTAAEGKCVGLQSLVDETYLGQCRFTIEQLGLGFADVRGWGDFIRLLRATLIYS